MIYIYIHVYICMYICMYIYIRTITQLDSAVLFSFCFDVNLFLLPLSMRLASCNGVACVPFVAAATFKGSNWWAPMSPATRPTAQIVATDFFNKVLFSEFGFSVFIGTHDPNCFHPVLFPHWGSVDELRAQMELGGAVMSSHFFAMELSLILVFSIDPNPALCDPIKHRMICKNTKKKNCCFTGNVALGWYIQCF